MQQYYDEDTEIAVLGCILDESSFMAAAVEIWGEAEVFYMTANKKLWQQMLEMFKKNMPVDALSVGHYVKDKPNVYNLFGGIVGLYDYLERLDKLAGVPKNFDYHCEKLLELWAIRKFQQNVQNVAKYLKNGDVERAMKEYQNTLPNRPGTESIKIADAISQAIDEITQRYQAKKRGEEIETEKLPTGLKVLDRQSSGNREQIMVIGGEPGSGKTALIQQIVLERAKQGYSGIIFPTEMSSLDIANRFVGHMAKVPITDINNNEIDDVQAQRIAQIKTSNEYQKILGWIQDVSRPSIEEIKAVLRHKKMHEQLDFAVIDHLQACRFETRYQIKTDAIGNFLYEILGIAKELKIHFIITSQLSREGRKAIGSPKSWMFRDSSAIEDTATLAILLQKSGVIPTIEAYEGYENEKVENLEEWAEIISCYIVKDRHNSTPCVPMFFNKQLLRFSDVTLEADWNRWEHQVGI